MMNFLVIENLEDHYEEWNRSIYLENNLRYDIPASNNEFGDDLPNLEFNMKQEQMDVRMNLNNEFLPGGLVDPLDDIDPDSLFYQKSFTELTPVKCDSNDTDATMVQQTLVPHDMFDPCLTLDTDLNVQNFNKNCGLSYGETNNSPNVTRSNIYEQSNLTTFISLTSHQDLEQQDALTSNDFSMLESCPEFDISIQDELEFQLFNSSQNQLTSECLKYQTPVYEGENESFETESNASSTDSSTSTHDNSPQESTRECGEPSWVKEIKVGKNNRPRGPKCWEFLLRLLRDNASNPSLVKWENPDLGSFKLVEKDKISAIWGNRPSKKKNGKIIKYESFARILRYHYKKGNGMVLPVSEKHLVYKFASEVMAAFRAGKIL